jgi:hypothetical protein
MMKWEILELLPTINMSMGDPDLFARHQVLEPVNRLN